MVGLKQTPSRRTKWGCSMLAMMRASCWDPRTFRLCVGDFENMKFVVVLWKNNSVFPAIFPPFMKCKTCISTNRHSKGWLLSDDRIVFQIKLAISVFHDSTCLSKTKQQRHAEQKSSFLCKNAVFLKMNSEVTPHMHSKHPSKDQGCPNHSQQLKNVVIPQSTRLCVVSLAQQKMETSGFIILLWTIHQTHVCAEWEHGFWVNAIYKQMHPVEGGAPLNNNTTATMQWVSDKSPHVHSVAKGVRWMQRTALN